MPFHPFSTPFFNPQFRAQIINGVFVFFSRRVRGVGEFSSSSFDNAIITYFTANC